MEWPFGTTFTLWVNPRAYNLQPFTREYYDIALLREDWDALRDTAVMRLFVKCEIPPSQCETDSQAAYDPAHPVVRD